MQGISHMGDKNTANQRTVRQPRNYQHQESTPTPILEQQREEVFLPEPTEHITLYCIIVSTIIGLP